MTKVPTIDDVGHEPPTCPYCGGHGCEDCGGSGHGLSMDEVICTGCGRIGPAPPPPALSCCPERDPVLIDSDAGIEAAKLFAEIKAERAAKTPQ